MERQAIKTTDRRAPAAAKAAIDKVVADLAVSGMSTAAFARVKGLPPWKLYGWLQTRAKSKSKRARATSLVPVRLSGAVSPKATSLELLLSGGHRLLIPADFDEVALRRLMGVLAGC
jgi:hypothetical protein